MHLLTLLRRAARLNPHGTSTDHGRVSRTWEETHARVLKLAGALSQLVTEDRAGVAILSNNSDRYLEAIFGAMALGGYVVPLNTRLSFREMAYCVGHSQASVLLVDGQFADRARELRAENPALRQVIAMDPGSGAGDACFDALIEAASPVDRSEESANGLAGLFYTGGTTGNPKGVMLSHSNIMVNTLNLQPAFRFSPETRCLHTAPMFHIAECFSIFGVTMAAGQHHFLPKFEVGDVLAKIERDRINFVALVPTMLKRMVEHERFADFDLSSLTKVFYGGSPLLEQDLNRALEAFSNVEFIQGYGLTETSPTITLLEPADHRRPGKALSVGRQVASVDLGIFDDNGNAMPVGERGEICIKGGTVMQGYWQEPETTAAAMRGLWFRTGDVGYLDEEGYLYIVDRAKDMIITGGENVYSLEVENVLARHPSVAECAVIGVPDESWGERVHAIVRLRNGCPPDEDALRRHCREHLTPYKCPRSYEFSTDPLPLSPVGKIDKKSLRKIAGRIHQHHQEPQDVR